MSISSSRASYHSAHLIVHIHSARRAVVDGALVDDGVSIVLDLYPRYPVAVDVVLFQIALGGTGGRRKRGGRTEGSYFCYKVTSLKGTHSSTTTQD